MKDCNCGSGKSFSECCEPVLKGKRKPVTAEELMRARYSAFVEKEIDFIMELLSRLQGQHAQRKCEKMG
jgi:SEC-C motif domain protein